MKAMRGILPYFGVLALLAFATTFVTASDTDCTTIASCGFGLVVGTATGHLTNGGFDNANFTETVYNNSGVYTYVFTITNVGPAFLHSANTFTGLGFDEFNPSLNYGQITSLSDVADTGFHFNSNSLNVGIAALGSTKKFTFYAQGAAPAGGEISVANAGSTTNDPSLDPAPEPGVLLSLGSLLPLLLFGKPFASKLRIGSV